MAIKLKLNCSLVARTQQTSLRIAVRSFARNAVRFCDIMHLSCIGMSTISSSKTRFSRSCPSIKSNNPTMTKENRAMKHMITRDDGPASLASGPQNSALQLSFSDQSLGQPTRTLLVQIAVVLRRVCPSPTQAICKHAAGPSSSENGVDLPIASGNGRNLRNELVSSASTFLSFWGLQVYFLGGRPFPVICSLPTCLPPDPVLPPVP